MFHAHIEYDLITILVINNLYFSHLLSEFITTRYLNCVKASGDIFKAGFSIMISLPSESLYFDISLAFFLFLEFANTIIIITEESKSTTLLDDTLYLVSVADTFARTQTSHRFLSRVCREGPHHNSTTPIVLLIRLCEGLRPY